LAAGGWTNGGPGAAAELIGGHQRKKPRGRPDSGPRSFNRECPRAKLVLRKSFQNASVLASPREALTFTVGNTKGKSFLPVELSFLLVLSAAKVPLP